jgi:hypothetical protein
MTIVPAEREVHWSLLSPGRRILMAPTRDVFSPPRAEREAGENMR